MNLWEQIIIEWVNCLRVLENSIKDVTELRDVNLYEKILRKSSWDGYKNTESEENVVLLFIKDEFPKFYSDLQDGHGKLEELQIVSLLLLYTASEPSFQRPMCLELHPDIQVKIKSYLEMLLPYEKNLTREILDEAIVELEDAAPKDLCITPKTKPLKEFFESPAARSAHSQRVITERMRELRQLKSDLETERFEKMDLQEDVRIQQAKILSLQKKLDEKVTEIKFLRAERNRVNTPQSCKKIKSGQYSVEHYKKEIEQLEKELLQSQSEGETVAEERDNLVKKMSLIEKQYYAIKEKQQHSEKSMETLIGQIELKDRELVELRMNNEELRSHLKELTRIPIEEPSFEGEMLRSRSPLPMVNVSESLSSVIDIQLQEAKEESAALRIQVDSLQNKLDALHSDHQLVLIENVTLQDRMRYFEEAMKKQEKQSDFLKSENETLHAENVTIQNDCKDLRDLLAQRESVLSEAEDNKKMLTMEVEKLKDDFNEIMAVKETELTLIQKKNNLLEEEKIKKENECISLTDSLALKEKLYNTEMENFKQLLTTKEIELSTIKETNETLEESLALKEKLLLEAEDKEKSLNLQIQGLKEILLTTEIALDSALEKNQVLEENQAKMENKCKEITDSLEMREKLLSESEHDRISLQKEIENLNNSMVATNTELISIKESNKSLAEEKLKMQAEYVELNHTLMSKERLLLTTETALNSALEKNQVLEENQAKMENKCKEITDSLEMREKLLSESEHDRISLQKEIENLNNAMVATNTELISIKESNKSLAEEKLKMQAEYVELNHTLMSKERLLLTTETALNSALEKNQVLEENQAKMENKCKDITDSLAMREQLLSKSEHDRISLQKEVENLNHAMDTTNTELISIKESNKSLAEEKLKMQAEYIDLNNTLMSKERLLLEAERSKIGFEADIRRMNDLVMETEASLLAERNKSSELSQCLSRVNVEYEENERNIKENLKTAIMPRLQLLNGSINLEDNLSTNELIEIIVKVLSKYEDTCNDNDREIKQLCIQLNNLQKELSIVNENTKILEEQKLIAVRECTDLKNLMQIKEELLVEKNALLDVLQTLVADLRREKDEHCDAENARMLRMQQVSEQLMSSMKDIKLLIAEMCPNIVEMLNQKTDSTSFKSDADEDNKYQNIINTMAISANDMQILQKGILELIETQKNLNKVLSEQNEVVKDIKETKEHNQLLNDKLENMQIEKRYVNECIGIILKHRKGYCELLSRIMSIRETVEAALTALKEKWYTAVHKYKDIFVTDGSMCDELKHLQVKKEEIENSVQNHEMSHLKNISPLTKILWQKFLWTEEKLEDVQGQFSSVQENTEFLESTIDDHLREGRMIIESEMEKHKTMQESIGKYEKEIETFEVLATSYKKNVDAGQIKKEPKAEEKLNLQIDQLSREKKDLKQKLDNMRVRNAKLEKNMDDLRAEVKRIKTEKSSDESTALMDMKNEIKNLEEQIVHLQKEKDELSKRPKQEEIDNRLKEVHSKYELTLENMKQKMKSAYNEQVAKMNKQQERAVQEKVDEMKQLCRKHSEEIKRYKEHVGQLSKQLWSVGENLLIAQKQNEEAVEQINDLKTKRQSTKTVPDQQKVLTTQTRTRTVQSDTFSMDSLPRQGLRTVELIHEERMYERRSSMRSLRAMGNAFNAEDEEGEVFDSVYLADMKEGRCVPSTHLDRLSVFQMRNSLCKPHLKSSYPAETQFHPLGFTEEDIKTGSVAEDVFNDSLTQSLLSEQKPKKKERTQISYKKPGPPTPSKNGGRLSLQGNEIRSPNSRILRDRNVERRTTITPRRLKDIFSTSSSKRQDENLTSTPKGRRLSSIFRKPRATAERF